MKCEWQRKKLSDIAIINPKESIPKDQVAKKIPMENLRPNCRDISEYKIEPFSGGAKFKNGDTIMARITPCLENGKVAKVNILNDNEVGFGSTEYIVFRAIEDISDEDFLYYLVISPFVKEPAIKSMVGSSGRQRVQIDVIKNLKLAIPDINEQRKIGNILHSLDDKIELNNALNQNLEQQAQAIFEVEILSKKEIPKGWQRSNLLDIADFLNGLAMQKFRPLDDDEGLPVLKIKELRQGICDDTSERCSSYISPKYIVHDGDVIFSWSGSLLVDFWCGGVCGLNQHLFKVTSTKYDKWFYYLWTKHYLDRFATLAADMATTMGHIKRSELAKSTVLIPSVEDYKRIGSIIEPIYNLIIENRIQNLKLTNLRDTLLPKLMSGELDVTNIDI